MIPNYSVVEMFAAGVIGYAAAQYKGYSPIVGMACGLLLGPIFAWVLFAIDGVIQAGERRRCPHCCEWVNASADVCCHCGNRAVISMTIAPPLKPGPPRLVWSKRE